ncbi:E3 ubiquitin-protein ligase [Musa troglodytarum]|uniref:RING-type E3 ubiquitin transferase n=1 Tax=Musa troglodytarum TaxID=320322 RepID=A0A9E7KDH2_9LILI|nr:E3 ubiquitin-protein ligase [Musa troglodytarum]
MAAKRHRRPTHGSSNNNHGLHLSLLLPLLILTPWCAHAQPSPPSDDIGNQNDDYYGELNPTVTVVAIASVSTFFVLVVFIIYIRRGTTEDNFSPSFRHRGPAARSLRQQQRRRVSPQLIETFPTLTHAKAKGLEVGKGALECAVCLSEFDDDDEVRLLPRCSHLFHTDCIDVWLASHVTCPVCRTNLSEPATEAGGTQPETATAPDHVTIVVNRTAAAEEETDEVALIGRSRREARPQSESRPAKFSRSHSTGQSVFRSLEDVDRYTLSVPDQELSENFAARKLDRSTSCVAFPTSGEESSRRGPGTRRSSSGRSR